MGAYFGVNEELLELYKTLEIWDYSEIPTRAYKLFYKNKLISV